MLNRILIAAGLLVIAGVAILFRTYVLPVLIIVFGLICYYETYKAFQNIGISPNLWTGCAMILGMIPMYYALGEEGILILYMILTMMDLIWPIFYPNRKYPDVVASVFLMFYPTFGFIALTMINAIEPAVLGTLGIAMATLIPSMSDIGALFIGKTFGRHKLAPDISPKKTIEGAVGGMICSILTGLLIGVIALTTNYFAGLALWEYLIIGFVCGMAAQIGDLTASALKRYTGVKDFGTVFMSHGGVMDRMDSILMGAVAVICLLKLMK
ncbi:MAG: phosphatidate cytidylyltransferase [Christensenellales bacterium]|jgi:phosphatidate cytidylyltransferase